MKCTWTCSILIVVILMGVVSCTKDPSTDKARTIRETGYMVCLAAEGCDGSLCTDADGTSTCESLPAECTNVATCSCIGARFCLERSCQDVDGGISCDEPQSSADLGREADSRGACSDVRATPAQAFTAVGRLVPLDATFGGSSASTVGAFEWSVIERPDESVAQPGEEGTPGPPAQVIAPDDPGTVAAVFVPDVPGRYVLKLLTQGAAVCDEAAAVVEIFAPEAVGLAVVVGWVNNDPRSPAPFSVGTHLVHPTGSVGVAPGDCSASNPNPDWGTLGDPTDDPLLGLDGRAPKGLTALAVRSLEDTSALGDPYTLHIFYEENWTGDPDEPVTYPPTTIHIQLYWDSMLVHEKSFSFDEGTSWSPAAELHFEAGLLRIVALEPPI
jgi:hypothetical protein